MSTHSPDSEPLAPRWRPTDHAWLDDGRGVLSCVAGDQHTATEAAACPYYLRADVLRRLPSRWRATRQQQPTLTWRGGEYTKISHLAAPADWPALLADLPARHRVRRLRWSLFSAIDLATVHHLIDPRDAFRQALVSAPPGPALYLLRRLAAELGDPDNRVGVLGLTGAAALDPRRLPAALTGAHDIDLMVYPAAFPDPDTALPVVLRSLGAAFPADLPDDDPRRRHFRASRLMPAVTTPDSADVFWRRRTDLAWSGDLRLDLTLGDAYQPVETLPYAAAPLQRHTAEIIVAGIGEGYPVRLELEHPSLIRVVVTARGYQTAFRTGDRLTVTGHLHQTPTGATYLSVDDCADHHLILRCEGEP